MGDSTFSLAGEFAPMDREQWTELAEAALKGAPLGKLVRNINGLTIQPLYTRADGAGGHEGWPGAAPFVRGSRPDRPPWQVQQAYRIDGLDAANAAIVTDLERGVTTVELQVDGSGLARLDDLSTVLAGVFDDLAPIGVAAEAAGPAAAALLLGLWSQRGRDPASLEGTLNLDPVGAWASGDPRGGPQGGLRALGDMAAFTRTAWPKVRVARADGGRYHDAGATEADELAFILATGVAYLEAMAAAGLTVTEAARRTTLRLAVDADLFLGVAKLRALRQTWSRILTASGAGDAVADIQIEASTSGAMMTARDPWVNLLRTTVAGFAAAVGGADVIHVRPFDEAIGLPDDLARRIARNTQVLLQDESHLGQVIDPAGGAWHVEDLTRQLAEAAWARFQSLQADGGIVAGLSSGTVQDLVDAAWAQRQRDIARRKQPITGVSEFPNLAEAPVARRASSDPSPSEGDDALAWPTSQTPGELTRAAVEAAGGGAPVTAMTAAWIAATARSDEPGSARPLRARRRSEGFEALRDASDGYRDARGRRPSVLLAKLGPLAEHTARVTYAKNFFEAGGIEAVDARPIETPDHTAAVRAEHPDADLAVLCGNDARYGAEAAAAATALKQAGIRTVYLAGRPGDHEAAFRAAGIDEFIYIGVDVLDVLQRAHAHLTSASEGDAQ